jgi:hypothetical protein
MEKISERDSNVDKIFNMLHRPERAKSIKIGHRPIKIKK